MTETTSDLNARFAGSGKPLDPSVLHELNSIMRIYQLSPEDLFFKWEAYCIKLNIGSEQPELERLKAFKQDLQDDLEKKTRAQVHIKTERRVGATPRTTNKSGDVYGMYVQADCAFQVFGGQG